ncbi:hypothetical protein ACH3XW_9010 [Acanthocheilonema viteae]
MVSFYSELRGSNGDSDLFGKEELILYKQIAYSGGHYLQINSSRIILQSSCCNYPSHRQTCWIKMINTS